MKHFTKEKAKAQSTSALSDARESLRANVLFRRTQLRLSQAELAEIAGIARPVLSKVETAKGDFQVSALAKIATALNCGVADLLATRRVRPISDAEISERRRAPRSTFIKGEDLWAAADEANHARRHAGPNVARRIPSGRRKRGAGAILKRGTHH
ncbi:MAG TPA: helix-turn-helix transcriptional regulator [Candidatus Tyrphobacter sp.]